VQEFSAALVDVYAKQKEINWLRTSAVLCWSGRQLRSGRKDKRLVSSWDTMHTIGDDVLFPLSVNDFKSDKRRPFNAGAWNRSQAKSCGICGGQCGSGTHFSLSTSVFRLALTNNEKCPLISSCLYTYTNATPNGGIFVKFDTGVFYENPSRNSKLG